MPFIKFTTTKTLTLQQEIAIKKVAGENISLIPNKREETLMIHIEDNQVMYFKGKEIDCMKISIELYKKADFEFKEKFAKKIMEEVERITSIPSDQIYLTYIEYEEWGKGGQLSR